jgi:hypothetical protein
MQCRLWVKSARRAGLSFIHRPFHFDRNRDLPTFQYPAHDLICRVITLRSATSSRRGTWQAVPLREEAKIDSGSVGTSQADVDIRLAQFMRTAGVDGGGRCFVPGHNPVLAFARSGSRPVTTR